MAHPKKFLKIFEKTGAKKSPGFWPGLKGSLDPRRKQRNNELHQCRM
jgi:hypothetical protein